MNISNISRSIVLCILLCASAGAADISLLIRQGKPAEARSALENLSRDSSRSANALYFAALLETDGRRSAGLLESAIQKSSDQEYREDIVLRLAHYYAIKGEYQSVAKVIEAGNLSSQAAGRLRALAAEMSGSPDDGRGRTEALLKAAGSSEDKQLLGIDKARNALASGKRKAAEALLGPLVKSRNRQVAPQALYLLCVSAIEAGRIDDAARWYNLLKDQYPGAVGLDGLVEKLGSMPSQPDTDTRAEKATGTFYSVKVGVFASAENAAGQAAKFSEVKIKVETIRKTIGGKTYSIVYVGRYASFDEAERIRQELESEIGEQYQVVAR